MEEILASIRRIIEDSDPGQPQAPSAQAVANDDGATRSGLADRAALRSPALPERNAVPASPREERVAPAPARAPEPAAAPVASVQPRQAEGRAHLAAADSSRPAMTSGKSVPAMERTPPEIARTEASAAPAQAPQAIATGAPLVSKDTGRHVSAAFDELAAAVEDTRRRSFDKMAQEMMRPMLQEWLDQNLPSLVERLVREEIVRITGSKADIAGKS